MGHGDLAAVRERRLQARRLAAIDDGDFVARSREVPGGGGADDAGTEDEHFHCGRSVLNWLRLVNAI